MDSLRHRALRVHTKLGPVRLVFSPRGLCRMSVGKSDFPVATSALARQLQAYATGKTVRFAVALDLSSGTEFQQKVWRALLTIPRGQTRSYGWMAKRIGRPRAARAVGAACGANPVGIIVPCHRVIAGDGSLGGYTGGIVLKRRLLRLEGVAV